MAATQAQQPTHVSDQEWRIFGAIASCVGNLNTYFQGAHHPIALYHRLITKTTVGDTAAIHKHIDAIKAFFEANEALILQGSAPAANSQIVYTANKVYLDVSKIWQQLDLDSRKKLREHFITIYSLINLGNEKGREALESLKQEAQVVAATPPAADVFSAMGVNMPNTKEGAFIKNAMTTITEKLSNIDDTQDTTQLFTTLASSGVMTDLMAQFQGKGADGLDPAALLTTVMGTITQAIAAVPPASQSPK